jgi:quinohemoprotein ethanol dehydrogenase
LLVFKLGGKAQLPELADAGPELVRPDDASVGASVVSQGEQLYAQHCATCHGEAARGGIKDLRRMSPATHREFLDIVLHGARREKGMASFDDVLSEADAKAVHAYLARRANEDWSEILKGN